MNPSVRVGHGVGAMLWRVEFCLYFAAGYPELPAAELAEVLAAFERVLGPGCTWARVHRLFVTEDRTDGLVFDAADTFDSPVMALDEVLTAAEHALESVSVSLAGHRLADIRIDTVADDPPRGH